MLAGTYGCEINAKSNGGYTPLHLAAQFSRQDVYDLLVKAYSKCFTGISMTFMRFRVWNFSIVLSCNNFSICVDADVNVRDHSGKKPMQYLVRQDTSVSMDTFKSESLTSPTPSVPGTRVRRHFSTASSNYYHNIRRASSIPLEVSLPTCNSASSTPNIPITPGIYRSPSSASSKNPVQLLSISSLGKQRSPSFSFSRPNIFIFPERHRRSCSNDELDSESPAYKQDANNIPSIIVTNNSPVVANKGDNNKPSGFRGVSSARRSFRQGMKYLMNNAVPKKNKTHVNINNNIEEEDRES